MNEATNDIAEYVHTALALQALDLDDTRRAAVTQQFMLLAAMAELFLAEPHLSDTSPAPLYRL